MCKLTFQFNNAFSIKVYSNCVTNEKNLLKITRLKKNYL